MQCWPCLSSALTSDGLHLSVSTLLETLQAPCLGFDMVRSHPACQASPQAHSAPRNMRGGSTLTHVVKQLTGC